MASFADYVKDLMGVLPTVNGNPMLSVTSMTDDNARYREDPFYKSRDIQARDQLALEEEERKRKEAEQNKQSMFSQEGSSPTGLTPYQMAFLENESKAERDYRMQQLAGMLTPSILKPFIGGAPVISNSANYNIRSPEQQRMDMFRTAAANQAAAGQASYGNYGFDATGNYYTPSYGGDSRDMSSLSPETRAGLEAAAATFGAGSDKDYFGD